MTSTDTSQLQSENLVLAWAAERNIDIAADLRHPLNVDGTWHPFLVRSPYVQVHERVTRNGANFLQSQIDYKRSENDQVRASRRIAVLMLDDRTELGYIKPGTPRREITVHQGAGRLVVAHECDDRVRLQPIDARYTPVVTVPDSHFFAIEGAGRSDTQELVVSSFRTSFEDSSGLVVSVVPGQRQINGTNIPQDFRRRFGE